MAWERVGEETEQTFLEFHQFLKLLMNEILTFLDNEEI